MLVLYFSYIKSKHRNYALKQAVLLTEHGRVLEVNPVLYAGVFSWVFKVLFFTFLFHFTACRNAGIASAVIAIAFPSVCPSVTLQYCVKTTARSTVQFALSDSKMCLVL